MKEARRPAYACMVGNCASEGKVPLCSGEMHLCSDHFDHWVTFLRKNPLLVEKWSTENYAAWNRHFMLFVHREVKLSSHCAG